jgi:hypothetical protein
MPKKKSKTLDAEIIRITDGAPEFDLTRLSTEQLERHIELLDAQLKRRQLELANLQVLETRELLASRHHSLLVEKYLREIAALDAITPGGLKSVAPSDGDDPELVAEAWRIYVYQQRGGGSRFG